MTVSKRVVRDLLVRSLALIDTPEKWTTKVAARNKYGNSVMATSDSATCFCSLGAISRAADGMGSAGWEPMARAIDALYLAFPNVVGRQLPGISEYNDSVGHEKVVAAFKQAIEDTA